MTPEAQRIAIAGACGWTDGECTVCGLPGFVVKSPTGQSFWDEAHSVREHAWLNVIPDYLNDLNVMHEAEKWLREAFPALFAKYLFQLRKIAHPEAECATASHRAEAFLRTLGLWKESLLCV